MNPHPSMMCQRPSIAVIDPNVLAAMGLRQALQNVMPMMEVDLYLSFSELEAGHPEHYFHFFVAMPVFLAHRPFFMERRMKTIVLSSSAEDYKLADGFHTILTHQSETLLLRALLRLEQSAHAHGRNLPVPQEDADRKPLLSPREVEVLALIVKGLINKEIADRLHISLPTVISHRKNVMTKLGVRSVAALTIYAVMHGYVDIAEI